MLDIIDIDITNVPYNTEEICLCLGYFDGVHLGHQALIKEALNEGYKVAVLSFDNSPSFVLGLKGSAELTSTADKAEIFSALGVSTLYLMHFDKSTLNVTRDEFIKTVLMKINPKKIFVGEDFRFGTRAEGNPEYLKRFFDVKIVDTFEVEGNKVSSRTIRDLVASGDIKSANKLLGRPYRLVGIVGTGSQIGRTIDFPTANLELDADYIYPKEGVYSGIVNLLDDTKKCLISVGTHPTINQLAKPIVEVFILDFDQNIYGETIYVDFIDFIREIRKFDSLDELKAQIELDKSKII